MSVEAAVIQYRQQLVDAFAEKVSMFRTNTTKESVVKGNDATFLVSGSASDTAVTRGVNGRIPFGNPTNAQVTARLVEKHAPYEMTGFNVFASQGDQVKSMRNSSINVINREIDLTNLAVLADATVDTGAATVASNALVQKSIAILGNAAVPVEEEDDMFGVVTPAFMAYIRQTPEFSSKDYVNMPALDGRVRRMVRWSGVNWWSTSLITGLGTSLELCYIYHRAALGYAVQMGEENIDAGYESKQMISWSRASIYHGGKILQDAGIVQVKHDGSAYVGA